MRRAALEALYAGLDGGLVMPCFEPVMTMAVGEEVERDFKVGKNVEMPFKAPKRLVSKI